MSIWKITINKDTSWSVTNTITKEQRKIWSKKDVEDFLDFQENLDAKSKSGNPQGPSN
jgi:hypothetical protein